MPYELPTDLIRQVKLVTRAEAGLSKYDPTRDLPQLPSLSEAVAAFDPSPPYLRCKNCKGRLLRGVESVLCIYCGRPNDIPPDPISFKDTFAYRWLLESLHLDGSEMVGLTTKKSELNRGQSTPKDEIPLSDFFNVKVTWPTEVEKKGTVWNQKTQERNSINLTGVGLDKLFSGSLRSNASDTPEEHSFSSNHVEAAEVKEPAAHNDLSLFENLQPSKLGIASSESKDVFGAAEDKEVRNPDDFSFFQNVQPAELASQASRDKDDDHFSVWDATFQSADSRDELDSSNTFDPFVTSAVSCGNQHESSTSSDPLTGSAVDLSSQLDSVFGLGVDLKDGKPQDDKSASPSMGDWNDDLWNNLSSNASQPTGQSDSAAGVKDSVPQDAQGFDWFGVAQWQSNNFNKPSNSMTHRDDDTFTEWNNFTSSTSVNVSSSENSAIQSHNQPIVAAGEASDVNLFSTNNKFEEIDVGSFSQADTFPSSSGNENVSAAMTDAGLEASSSVREVDTESDTSQGRGQPARDGDVKTAGNPQSEEVERILLQMHDLSFMLDDSLSLPPNSNNLHS